jgi:hypothetical protein
MERVKGIGASLSTDSHSTSRRTWSSHMRCPFHILRPQRYRMSSQIAEKMTNKEGKADSGFTNSTTTSQGEWSKGNLLALPPQFDRDTSRATKRRSRVEMGWAKQMGAPPPNRHEMTKPGGSHRQSTDRGFTSAYSHNASSQAGET